MIQPYLGKTFLGTLKVLFVRLFALVSGHHTLTELASDEVQILTLSLLSISAAIVGVFIIHRRMTMLANALSHTVIFGIVLTYLILRESSSLVNPALSFKALLIAAAITGLITSYLSHLLTKISKLQRDASIGLIFTTFFALGILLVTLFSRNSHIGIDMIMGNVDALHIKDLSSVFKMTLFNVALAVLLFRGLKLSTFDPLFSKLQGFSPTLFNILIITQLSLTSIGAFRAIGVVLVLAFFVVPPQLVRRYSNSLEKQILLSALVGVVASTFGVALSRHFLSVYSLPLSTGGLTTLMLYALYFLNEAGHFIYQKLRDQKVLRQGDPLVKLND